jgi:hypothetical protein
MFYETLCETHRIFFFFLIKTHQKIDKNPQEKSSTRINIKKIIIIIIFNVSIMGGCFIKGVVQIRE